MFNELECWTEVHLLYAITGFFAAVVFLSISLLTTFVYFEKRALNGNVLAKVNGRAEMSN